MSLNFPGLFYFLCYLVLVESHSYYNTVAFPGLVFRPSTVRFLLTVQIEKYDNSLCPKSTFFKQGELLETKIAIEYG